MQKNLTGGNMSVDQDRLASVAFFANPINQPENNVCISELEKCFRTAREKRKQEKLDIKMAGYKRRLEIGNGKRTIKPGPK